MSDSLAECWKDLTDSEKVTCDELNGHRAISDWPGFDEAQDSRWEESKKWLVDRLEEIKDEIKNSSSDENHKNKRYNRRDYIDAVVNHNYRTIHDTGPNYPANNCWDNEKVYIEEREYYLAYSSQYESQKQRKLDNLHWLEGRRKYVYNQAEGNIETDAGPGWDKKHRKERYDNLQIATHYGSAWEEWDKTHDDNGDPIDSSSWRDKVGKWQESHTGITESPANSNCDSRSDGIRTSQDGCANGTWLRYQPWCGCWAWSGLYAAGLVKKGDSWMASVASIEDYAKAKKGPFKGWTTDGSKAKKGDLVVLFGRGQHVGTVRSVDSNYCYTWEGNTSSSSGGSQSNGGGSYKRSRSRSGETYGYALVEGN
jgi:hypothetical protein